MNSSIMIRLALAISVIALAQIGCTTGQNTNTATPTAAATPAATPDKTAITAELTRIENDWPRVIKERDGAAVRRVEADDIVLVYLDGSTGDKNQDVKDIEAGNLSFELWEISELTVNVIDSDSAVATLRVNVKNGVYKNGEGQSQNISGQYRFVDTFAQRNGQWQLVASATTPIKNPAPSASPKASPGASPSPATKATPATKPAPPEKTAPAKKPATTPPPVTSGTP